MCIYYSLLTLYLTQIGSDQQIHSVTIPAISFSVLYTLREEDEFSI
ncbi:hypothetical protein VCR17J2_340085 [Vibrio coralliirubri]|nr:hypothetical protein VCR17J2_340085 [Vibrio coralliirubri]